MTTSTTNGKAAEEEAQVDPYELARKSAEADQTRERDRTDLFRRQNTFQYAIMTLLSLAVVTLAFTHKVETKVIIDRGGRLEYGSINDISTPTDENIRYALADYVTCLREVSNDDLRMQQCHDLTTDIMTQNVPPNGHAKDDVEAYWRKNNPNWLARNLTRTVLNDRDHPFDAKRIGGNTFYVHYFERVHDFQHGDSYFDHSGTVVIAPPFVPTDETLLHLDPTGTIVIGIGLNL